MRLALSLLAALSSCTAVQDEPPVADPMASFARFLPGVWRMTLVDRTTSFTEWHWGPGKHSIRAGALELYYWHPGLGEVRMLSLHQDIPAVGRGVGEGSVRFDGETADGVFDLYQPRGPRKMGLRWVFDGPDQYTDTLLEATGPEGLEPINRLVFFRDEVRRATTPNVSTAAEPVKALEPLLGGAWRSQGHSKTTLTTFEAIPDYVYARVVAPQEHGEAAHVLDAYFYEHVGTRALRCLALSDRGGVYEGDVTVLEGGALQLDLKGYEGDRVVPYVVRIDFEADGTLRQRVWSGGSTDREPTLDTRHARR